MTAAKALTAVAVAFVAGLALTLVVLSPAGNNSAGQHIETADVGPAEDRPTVVALADTADRSLLRVTGLGDEPTDTSAAGSEGATNALRVDLGGESDTTGTDDSGTAEASDGDDGTAEGSAGNTADSNAPASNAPASNAPASTKSTTQSGAGTNTTGSNTGSSTSASGSGSGSSGSGSAGSPTSTTSRPSTTARPSTTRPPTTTTARPSQGSGEFESIRNNNPLFDRYADVPSNRLSVSALTESAPKKDNGDHPDGNFRMACAYSHFSYDDPIVFPGQPGKSHLHMFFGNTEVDAYTTADSLMNSGGGSCNGFELNRSGYWTPALLDGKGSIVVPDKIILYYKTKQPQKAQPMPAGLKMIAGNPTSESFSLRPGLGWACGKSGSHYNKTNRIPNNCGGNPINAEIQFPNCWDGKNLDSSDHMSHMRSVREEQNCPSSHPVRLPTITILLYFPPGNTSGWYLSSDRTGGFNAPPGGTLHADWFGGWNEEALDLWMDGCIKATRNCSFGQTGTSRQFTKISNSNGYDGNNFLPMS